MSEPIFLTVMFLIGLACFTYAIITPGQQGLVALVGGGLMGWPLGALAASFEKYRRYR